MEMAFSRLQGILAQPFPSLSRPPPHIPHIPRNFNNFGLVTVGMQNSQLLIFTHTLVVGFCIYTFMYTDSRYTYG